MIETKEIISTKSSAIALIEKALCDSNFSLQWTRAFSKDTGIVQQQVLQHELLLARDFASVLPQIWQNEVCNSTDIYYASRRVIAAVLPRTGILQTLIKLLYCSLTYGTKLHILLPSSLAETRPLMTDWALDYFGTNNLSFSTGEADAFTGLALQDDNTDWLCVYAKNTGSKGLQEQIRRFRKKIIYQGRGLNPFVVIPGADVTAAVSQAVESGIINGGDDARSSGVYFVHTSMADAFIEQLADQVTTLKCGDTDDEESAIGPVKDDTMLNNIIIRMNDAKQQGAAVLTGGKLFETRDGLLQGYRPSVVVNCTMKMKLTTEVNDGPLFPVVTFSDEKDLSELMNHMNAVTDVTVFGDTTAMSDLYFRQHFRHVYHQSVAISPTNKYAMAVDGGFREAAFIWEWQQKQLTRREGPWQLIQELKR